MSPSHALPALVAILVGCSVCTAQQAPNTEFRITKIEPAFQDTPNYGVGGYKKSKPSARKPGQWLEIEVTFDWQPRLAEPLFTEELTVNYYVLLNNKSPLFPKPVLLTGSVTHVQLPQEKDLKSVIYLSPRELNKFFGNRIPGTVSAAVSGVGVTLSAGGTVVATNTTKGKGAWWETDAAAFDSVAGLLLNKNETPFAPLAWDYYEIIKSK